MPKATPMVQQYLSIKQEYPDSILFFRMGDFYEMFFEDAKVASRILEIALTSRNKNDEQAIPMCGVPHHAAQSYVAQLIEHGFKVAICEQLEDPKEAKGIVKRDVVRVITPGVVLDTEILDAKSNNFLLALHVREGRFGVATLDISTGSFAVTESGDLPAVLDECRRIEPRETLVAGSFREHPDIAAIVARLEHTSVNYLADEIFELESARTRLIRQFKTYSLEGFGCHDWKAGICAAGGLLHYVDGTLKGEPVHLSGIRSYALSDFMVIDETTKANLELFETMRNGEKRGSLLGVMDCTVTAMGGRKIRSWMCYPLLDCRQIQERLDSVEEAKGKPIRDPLRKVLKEIHDLERLNAKIALDRCNARDMAALRQSIQMLPELRRFMGQFEKGHFSRLNAEWDDLSDVGRLLEDAICDNPPITVREGGIIKPTFDPRLAELVRMSQEGKGWIAKLQDRERKATGINTLKVGFNKVFGYYIEVSKAQVGSVPPHYVRKQTLVNGERYISEDLKEYESKVLGAEEKRAELEYDLFCAVRESVARENRRLGKMADIVAQIDVLTALGELAEKNDYTRPVIHENGSLFFKESRHPVVERLMTSERFVPNTVEMDDVSRQVLIVTGPNMAGKSTVLRQVALLVLMAQMGSFVPAEEASVGIVDRIFTRVGASDNLTRGQSTFMVEMQESANILNNATGKSLVILDEIGRGTSTFDGLSIAWAVAEYLHDRQGKGVKTVFATHYHELTDLATTKARVKNYNVAVKEWNDEIIFLRRLVEGSTNRSYGIQVARLAGIPEPVVLRAKEILKNIEEGELGRTGPVRTPPETQHRRTQNVQLSLFQAADHAVLQRLKQLEPDLMTPIEALNTLHALKELL